MERLRQKLAGSFSRAEADVEQWKQHHRQLLSLLSTVQSILAQLPVFSKPANYGVLAEVDGYVQRLQAQQIGALESSLSKVQAAMASLQSSVQSLSKSARDAQRLVASQRPQLTKEQLNSHSGCEASLQSCITGLERILQMHMDEYRLMEQTVPRFTHGSNPGDLAAIAALLADQPNVHYMELSDILEKGRLTSAGERRS